MVIIILCYCNNIILIAIFDVLGGLDPVIHQFSGPMHFYTRARALEMISFAKIEIIENNLA
jgi:hypothetical protein